VAAILRAFPQPAEPNHTRRAHGRSTGWASADGAAGPPCRRDPQRGPVEPQARCSERFAQLSWFFDLSLHVRGARRGTLPRSHQTVDTLLARSAEPAARWHCPAAWSGGRWSRLALPRAVGVESVTSHESVGWRSCCVLAEDAPGTYQPSEQGESQHRAPRESDSRAAFPVLLWPPTTRRSRLG